MSLWTIEIDEAVAVARYANPPMNYFCGAAMAELEAAIESWKDPAVRAVVLTGGVPDRFITHFSVEELVGLASDRDALRQVGTALTRGYHDLLGRLRSLEKPVLIGMTGDTMGGGLELSLAADVRIAQRGDFRIGFPEATLGILPGGSGTQRMSRLVGAGRAIDFILRGKVCPPEEALAIGLVHEVADAADARAIEVARELTRLSPVAVAQIKRSVYTGSDTDLAAGLEIESACFFETMLTDEAVEAMRAYVALPFEKRRDWIERMAALQGRTG